MEMFMPLLTHYLPVVSYDTEQTLKTLQANGNVNANFNCNFSYLNWDD